MRAAVVVCDGELFQAQHPLAALGQVVQRCTAMAPNARNDHVESALFKDTTVSWKVATG